MKTKNDVTALIGNTPMVRLRKFAEGASGHLYGKLEARNPGSSVKDRIALAMIESAEQDGCLEPGAVVVEPTSGNTGIGLAMVGRLKGYRVMLTMPESMSVERRKLLRAFGAELVLTDAKDGMPGAIAEAEQLVRETPGAFMPKQFDNPANPAVHFRTTGPEIWEAMEGKVDVLVAGVGTGGTVSGAGKFLKEQNPKLKVVAVEPEESAVISGGPKGPHMIQGIGAGFIPGNLDLAILDETLQVSSRDAVAAAKELAVTDCVSAGISSGAAAHAARIVANRPESKDARIAVILPDTAERYMSTLLFYED